MKTWFGKCKYVVVQNTSVKNAKKWKLVEYVCNLIIRDIVNLVRIHQFYEGQIAL